ncbi:hypothetical protein ACO3EC_006519, partial [Pseudomonas aeruginosa]
MGISLRKNKGFPARKGEVPCGWRERTGYVHRKKRPARFPALAALKVSAARACVGNADEHGARMALEWAACLQEIAQRRTRFPALR